MREDAPWLYELAMEVYKAVKSGDETAIEFEMRRLQQFSRAYNAWPLHGGLRFRGGRRRTMFDLVSQDARSHAQAHD